MKNTVVFNLLGTTLDQGFNTNRWNKWRPSICICQHDDLLIDTYHLIYQNRFSNLCNRIIEDIHTVSPETEIIAHALEFSDPWDFEEVYEKLYNFSSRFSFIPDNEDYLFHITTGTHVAQICIYLLTESRNFPGKLLQTSPSRDSCGTYTIIDLDLSKYDRIAARFQQELKNDISFLKSGIETKNQQFNYLIERIEQVVLRSHDPVLLTGPTGAGKSLLARRIYELKKIRGLIEGEFIEVNCATLRGDAAMSALFGHKKGSFTGAVRDRAGLLKSAHKGIIFLDEIGELGLDEQTMLLRAIEEKKFIPLGSDKEESSDFQLICGTNKDLKREIKSGKFRDDLLARINLWTFDLPGLKDRTEDIEPNIQYELNRYEEKYGRRVTFNKEARDLFLSFAKSLTSSWKSNFRDLNAAITRMGTLAPGGRINNDIVNEEIKRLRNLWEDTIHSTKHDMSKNLLSEEELLTYDLFDKIQLNEVIKICTQYKTISDAGRKMFAVSRKMKNTTNDADRLRKYLDRFGIKWSSIQKYNDV